MVGPPANAISRKDLPSTADLAPPHRPQRGRGGCRAKASREGSILRLRLEARAGKKLDDALLAYLIFLAGMHDLGKTNHPFQEMLRQLFQVGERSHGHVLIVFRTIAADSMLSDGR